MFTLGPSELSCLTLSEALHKYGRQMRLTSSLWLCRVSKLSKSEVHLWKGPFANKNASPFTSIVLSPLYTLVDYSDVDRAAGSGAGRMAPQRPGQCWWRAGDLQTQWAGACFTYSFYWRWFSQTLTWEKATKFQASVFPSEWPHPEIQSITPIYYIY